MRRFLILLIVAFVGAGRAPAASATPQLQIISQNPDFITLAVRTGDGSDGCVHG